MLILSVDDDCDDSEIFCDAVQTIDPNISCTRVESGIGALQFLDKADELPDYMFIDINMPRMTGIECVQRIRSVPLFSGIQIVMYSTAFSQNDHLYLSKAGIQCLLKPNRFGDLVNSLKGLLINDIAR